MKSLLAALKMFRPINLVLGTIAVLVAAALMPAWPETAPILFTIIVAMCYNAAANAINDWFDYDTDAINRPDRPLVSGALPKWSGLTMALALFALGTLLAWELEPLARNIAIFIALPLLLAYTPIFKGVPLAGNAVVALILGITFLYSGAAFGALETMWVPALMAFGFTFLREVVKDIEDLDGDSAAGLATFPVKYGLRKSVNLARFLTLFLIIALPLPYILGIYGRVFLVALLIGVELPLAYTFFYLKRHPDQAGCSWVAKVLKVDIFAALLATYLSKFDV